MTITEYYMKIKGCGDALRNAGEVVTDRDLILFIFGGLRKKYDLVVVNVSSKKEPVPIDDVYSMLLS